MDSWLFALLFMGLLGGISIIIFYKCHIGFAITFFFHGSIYVAVSIWESPLWNPGDIFIVYGGDNWHYGFWGLMQTFIVPLTFLTMFIYAQSREEDYVPFGKEYSKEASLYLLLLIGDWMTFGVMEDFGCYVIWGLDKFYDYAHRIHASWFLGVPTLYWMIIPGIILQTLALIYSRQFRKKLKNKEFSRN